MNQDKLYLIIKTLLNQRLDLIKSLKANKYFSAELAVYYHKLIDITNQEIQTLEGLYPEWAKDFDWQYLDSTNTVIRGN
jgi:hypothetical protein